MNKQKYKEIENNLKESMCLQEHKFHNTGVHPKK